MRFFLRIKTVTTLGIPRDNLSFPDGSGSKYTCNAGDTSSIPGSGRFSVEGRGYQLQYGIFLPV